MSRKTFNLVHELARMNAIECVRSAPAGHRVTVGESNRSLDQNARLHAVLTDIAEQTTYLGRKLTMPQWKTLIISGHAVATGLGVDMIPGLEAEFVNIRESSANMTVARMTSLIEYAMAYGAMNGVVFGGES